METKKCSQCKSIKSIDLFPLDNSKKGGHSNYCKPCKNEKVRAIKEKNKEKYTQKAIEWKALNKNKVSIIKKRYRDKNRDKINEYSSQYNRVRKESDPLFKMKEQTRKLISRSFKRKYLTKTSPSYKILGCTWEEFFNHLLKTAKNNYPKKNINSKNLFTYDWHIDHIIPIITANNEEDVLKLNHYKNLQLLTPEDNLKKGSSLFYENSSEESA